MVPSQARPVISATLRARVGGGCVRRSGFGGLAATRLHLKCRPRTPGPFDDRTAWVFERRTASVPAVGNPSQLADLTTEALTALLSDESLSSARQREVLDELSRRAAARHKAEEMADLVATVPVLAALGDSAEGVRQALVRLDQAKRVRASAVQAALAEGYSVRTVADIAQMAPSTALRICSQHLTDEPPSQAARLPSLF